MKDLSLRAQMVTRRTYNRPLDEAGTVFETWKETVNRVVHHQVWLWERQLGRKLNIIEAAELEELRTLMEERKALLSGRTLWLGGTDTAKAREASQFNCAFTHVETVYDVVDVLWLLLQGCGARQTLRPVSLLRRSRRGSCGCSDGSLHCSLSRADFPHHGRCHVSQRVISSSGNLASTLCAKCLICNDLVSGSVVSSPLVQLLQLVLHSGHPTYCCMRPFS